MENKPEITRRKRTNRKPAEREKLVQFVALPTPFRTKEFGYYTLQDFAKENSVNPGTISQWLKEEEIQNKIKDEWKNWGRNRTPDVIAGLLRTAVQDGSAAEVKLWMQIIENWTEKIETDITINPLKSLLIQIADDKANPIKKENSNPRRGANPSGVKKETKGQEMENKQSVLDQERRRGESKIPNELGPGDII